ncbi:NACHT domain-containing protein [Anaerolineae bacterium CFX7]|nr:NACHT domain-containing protein [Anaerolineae bacterium CFX7]
MDPSTLASEVVKILLPFLVAGGAEIAKGAIGEVGKKGLDAGLDTAQKIWEKLRPKLNPNGALKKIAARPDDARAQGALELEIEDALQENPALANELQIFVVQGDYNAVNLGAGAQAQQIAVGREIRQTIYHIYQNAPGRAALDDKQFEQFLSEYQDWIGKAYNRARLYGLEAIQAEHKQVRRTLADVFVPLTLRRFAPLERDEIEWLAKQEHDKLAQRRAYLELVRHKRQASEPLELKNLLVENQRLAIIGGAGYGKSTLLAHLAAGLSLHAQTGAPLPFELPHGVKTLVPLIIPLRYFRKYQELAHAAPTERLRDKGLGTLAGFIKDYLMRRSAALRLSEDFFDRLLLGGGCLVMLDGLDEVVSRDERGRVRQLIENLVHEDYPKNHYIVTAREAGYQHEAVFSPDDFTRLDVQPLERDEIQLLVEHWCQQLYPSEVNAKTDELMRAIDDLNARRVEQNLEPLISTPLMTTMVVSVSFGEKKLPNERAKLYEAAVTVILQAQYLREDVDGAEKELVEWGGTVDEQREWLAHLALEMHKGGDAGAAVEEERVREILRGVVPPDKLEKFILAVRDRGSLFEERAELFQFVHLTFQEFLAARELAKQRKEAWTDLAPRLTDSWWRETLLLLYGFARIDRPQYAEQYLEWLATQPENSPCYLAGLELAGQAVLELETPNPALETQQAKRLAAALENRDTRATGILRANAGNVLAHLGDPRTGIGVNDDSLPDLLFCEIPYEDFWMGSSKNKNDLHYDPEAYGDEVGLSAKYHFKDRKAGDKFYITRYPITNAQFDAFIQDPDGFKNPDWWKGLAETDNQSFPPKEGGAFDLPNHPVVNVTWYQAAAFCRWLNNRLQNTEHRIQIWRNGKIEWSDGLSSVICRLSSEAEWEKAARTRDGRKYPWGPDITTEHANYRDTEIGATSAVGCFPKAMNEYGMMDMSGNVWEWCATKWVENYSNYSQQEDNRLEGGSRRVLRGGAFGVDAQYVRCAFRNYVNPDYLGWGPGFRVVLSPA